MSISRRKNEHLKLTSRSQIKRELNDTRFNYEPLLSSYIESNTYSFLKKEIGAPIFISSITGGSSKGAKVNRLLGEASKRFNLPMGLGSIRAYLNNSNKESFKIRSYTGYETQLFANIGICQIQDLLELKQTGKITEALKRLEVDGVIIHINPLQEWVQPEGDKLKKTPLTILNEIVPELNCNIIVKEVGCGFGPKSLEELLKLPVNVVDFAGFGGTNFTKMELLRSSKFHQKILDPFNYIGNTPDDMIKTVNNCLKKGIGKEKEFIISGGIENYLDGYFYNSILNAPSIYGYAGKLLKYAMQSEKKLNQFLELEIESYNFASNFLTVKEQ